MTIGSLQEWFRSNNKFSNYYLLLFLAFSLMLERIPSFDVSGTTVRVSGFIVLIMLIKNFNKIIPTIKNNKILYILFIFLISYSLSATQSIDLLKSIKVFAFTVYIVITTVLIISILEDIKFKDMEPLLRVFRVCALLTIILCIWQYGTDQMGLGANISTLRDIYSKGVLGFSRIQGFALEPLYMCNYLLIPITFGLMTYTKSGKYNKLLMLLLAVVLVSASRGGMISMALIILVSTFLCWIFKLLSVKRIVGLALIISIAYGISFMVPFLAELSKGSGIQASTQKVRSFSSHINNFSEGSSVVDRNESRRVALEIWKDNKILGVGPGNFGPQAAIELNDSSLKSIIVNNEPLEILAESGIVGFIIILIFVLMLSRGLILNIIHDHNRVLSIALLSMLLGFGLQYQTISTLYIMHIWFIIALSIYAINKKNIISY